ncbi:MAG: hypothetical protein ABR564_06915 [Candidatus Dormibacteria bacterium]
MSENRDDDVFERRVRDAREGSEGSVLPSEAGLGPGAGDTPPGTTVHMDPVGENVDVPGWPTLNGVPRQGSRPVYKSSQLDGVEPKDGGEGAGG